MKKAKENIEGSQKEQYVRLWDNLGELLRTNLGSTAKMDTIPQPDSPPQFKRLYICLDAYKRGFKPGCRPFICMDGTFLKGYYGGQLLTIVGQDANRHLFPVTYAIVDSQTRDNCKFFLELLYEDLGDNKIHGWNFTFDQQKVKNVVLYFTFYIFTSLQFK